MLDQIGTADMMQGSLTSFTSDRFGNLNSALELNGGWTQVPSGVYFDTPEFSISVWVYPQQVGSFSRIIDFGNGPYKENLVFGLTFGTSLHPYVYLNKTNYESSTILTTNAWQHVAATYDGNNLNIYLNGLTVMSYSVTYSLPLINRTYCYVGKSNWVDGYSWSYFDDLRFYNKSFTQTEIMLLMNENGTCKYFH